MEKTLVDPEKVKYCLTPQGRYITTKKILEKLWLRSHIVWSWHTKVPLETLRFFLKQKYAIHHKNNIITDDRPENLELIPGGTHNSLHTSGENNPMWGKKHTPEALQKMRGKKRSPEICRKISEALKGERNPHYGKPRPPETCKKISAAQKGEKNHMWEKKISLEHRKKLNEGCKNWWKNLTPKDREKRKEKVFSPEARRKRSEAQKKRWEKKKSEIQRRHF